VKIVHGSFIRVNDKNNSMAVISAVPINLTE